MSRANVFGMPPKQHAKVVKAAEKRIRDYQPPPAANIWENAPDLKPTVDGYAHGIVGGTWVLQCDGCGDTETLELARLHLMTFKFNTSGDDSRRLCRPCRDRAGWKREGWES